MAEPTRFENTLDTRLTVLEHDLSKITEVLSKLENSFEKLVEVSTSLKHILAIHEMKFDYKEKEKLTLGDEVEELKKRIDTLEQFRWYVYGAFAIVMFLSPLIYKFIFKI